MIGPVMPCFPKRVSVAGATIRSGSSVVNNWGRGNTHLASLANLCAKLSRRSQRFADERQSANVYYIVRVRPNLGPSNTTSISRHTARTTPPKPPHRRVQLEVFRITRLPPNDEGDDDDEPSPRPAQRERAKNLNTYIFHLGYPATIALMS